MKKGSLIGNFAQDLGLDLKRLRSGQARLVSGESIQYVELKADKGVLVVKERIDREQLCGDTTPCSISFEMILENPMELHQITVEVTDINDHSPTFKRDNMHFEISETATNGARFPLATAEDLDVGVNGMREYLLSDNDHFVLKQHANADGKKYADMVLQKPLDRETNPNLSLKLIAVDGGTPQRSGSVNIDVIVLDANDNAPVFNQSLYKATVTENSAKNTYVTTVNASDADFGSNCVVTYYFSDLSSALGDLFKINETSGVILTAGSIDFEKDKKFELHLHAKDQGGLTDYSKVIIDVGDVNDNAPVISVMSFTSPLSEDSPPGTTIGIINVKDVDSGDNGQVSCKIEGSTPFKIKSNLRNYYTLITDSVLDRESVAEYNITVIATDGGAHPLSAKRIFTLKVSDVNDNAPVFSDSVYSAFVSENNSPGISVLTLKAKDPDDKQNARISYVLEGKNVAGSSISEYVSVNVESGVVLAVRSFDYEQIKELVFIVKAQDGGSPPFSNNVTVKILIQDQNDNPPQVLYPVQTGGSVVAEMVPRSADVGYLVTKVVAVDVDSGQNAWLSYKLQKATDRALFEVGLQNGEIRTIRQVTDKDAVKQRLTVIVEDNGQPSRSATVIVNVAVADSFPEVLSEFTDFPHDKEYNDNLTFYLVLALAVVSFLFITCLVVIISVKIYRWRQSRILYHSSLPVIPYYPPRYSDTLGTGTLPHVYNYEVCRTTDSRKSDNRFGGAGSQNMLIIDPSSTGTMQRMQSEKSILDEADSPLEDLGLDLKRLRSGQARIVSGESIQYIELKADKGVLIVKERIDREQLCGATTPCSFSFEMILENPMELHQITVEVTDINDHSPTFKRDNMHFEISETATNGARFPLATAEDLDVGVNGMREYLLSDNDHFVLKQLSNADGKKYAEMVLQKPLDRETKPNLSLKLIAVDGGTPQRSGSVNIDVIVLDANDNAPVFNQSLYKATVTENSAKNTYVTTVNASDADFGSNCVVTYYFSDLSSALGDLFKINETSGVILTAGSIDFEKDKKFELHLHAKDQGGLTDYSKVIIDVGDVNDNAPVISVMSFTSPLSEDSPPGTTIGIINVKDVDSGDNGRVSCKIEGSTPFKIKSNLRNYYTLITDSVLDRESVAEYNITVIATDGGAHPLSAKRIFTLKVSDVNDNAPVFSDSVYSAFVSENNSPGISVLTLKAKDPDDKQNARISYVLEGKNVAGSSISEYVSVNVETGVVLAVRSFDYEQIKELVFVVKAQDGGSPPLSSNVTVKILIQDQNDNPPQVLYPVQTGGSVVAEMVPRSADVGYLVTKVVAVDVDSGQNAWLSYKLQKATDRALFEVGLQNGEIRTIRQVTDKDAVKQRLTVIVEDNGQPSRSATVIVNVAVADSFPEVLSEFTDFPHDKEYNDNLTFYLVLALAVVSFLFITCLVVIISVKIYRWRQSRILYHSSLPVIPYYPPRYSDTLGTGTLPHVYNYEVCRTTDSRKSDNKFGGAGNQNVLIMDPSSTGTMQRIQSEKSILDEPDSPVEEMKKGSVIGNVAQDLGLDVNRLRSGRARIVTGENVHYAELNADKGILLVNERIDREHLCGDVTPCSFSFELILEKPMELHRITVEVLDINDHAPVFPSKDKTISSYSAYITENNPPGYSIFAVRARDSDWKQNARISYLLEETQIVGNPVSAYVSLNAETGVLSAVRSLDYEQIKEFELVVKAQDGGSPPLSSNVTVKIFIQDQNDNPPQVLYPVQTGGSMVAEMVPRSADVGYLVTKVVAVDVDSGQNAWLSYKLQKATDRALFEVGLQNGEIRTIRQVTDKDAVKQRLTVIVEDNGQPSRSATVIVNVAVADSFPEVLSEFTDFAHDKEYNDNLTFYLVLALAVVSFLFITCLVVIISVKIYRWRQSRLLYHSSLPVIPYYPPRYSDTLGTGTLPHVYNYEVCRTTDSRKSDNKFGGAGSQNVLIMDPSSTGTMQRIQSEKSILDEPDSPLEVSYSIPEEMTKGSLVGNIAQDLGLDLKRLHASGKARIHTGDSMQSTSSLTRERGSSLSKKIDRREKLSVMMGEPQRSAMQIHITVLDANDNAPVFTQPVYKATVQENSVKGTTITKVSASDADKGSLMEL
ncbi:hypothetical protein CRENBAI_021524 [Crenichthys baileyi]|uniref:Cadherin domain-containing protein n=1 Tax=Crenichthys baileyi TaxID=28760 RepID=A0AAV9R1N0_9TELE